MTTTTTSDPQPCSHSYRFLRKVIAPTSRVYTDEQIMDSAFNTAWLWDEKDQVFCIFCLDKKII